MRAGRYRQCRVNFGRPFADIGPTSLPTSPDVGPMCLCCLGDNVARKLRFAHLWILTISGHVIVVSAQQRAGCKLNAKWKWIRGRLVFSFFFVVFSFVVCIGSFFKQLSLFLLLQQRK
jgi:hypothetical protein